MTLSARAAILLLPLAVLVAQPLSAADDAALLKDLSAALRVLDLPCGEVLSAQRLAGNDHIASCKNGLRYRIFVNAEGRVVARKQ